MHSILLIRALPLVCLLLLLGGCSSGSSSSSGTSDTEDTTDPSPDPSPEPGDDGTGPGPGADDEVSATACFPSALLTTGNVLTWEQRLTTSHGLSGSEPSTLTVAGPDTFNDQSVIRVFGTREYEDWGVVASLEFFFSKGDDAVVLEHGGRTDASSGPGQPASTTEYIYNPPRVERYDLSPGEGFEQSFEEVGRTTESGTPFDSNPSFDESTTYVVGTTYVGRESVTVPAGTFSACKYEETRTATPAPIVIGDQEVTPPPTVLELTIWYAVGSGFPLRSVQVSDSLTVTSELLSLSINNVPVTGN